jgi:hypothetical protein
MSMRIRAKLIMEGDDLKDGLFKKVDVLLQNYFSATKALADCLEELEADRRLAEETRDTGVSYYATSYCMWQIKRALGEL